MSMNSRSTAPKTESYLNQNPNYTQDVTTEMKTILINQADNPDANMAGIE